MKYNIALILTFLCINGYCQNVQSFEIPNYGAKSPEAASFLKYGEYPVDLSTGVPNISIPLYTIEAKGLQVPITLNYHASGIKVNQEASWVGLGWNLNYGAQIILNVRDDVDEGNSMIDHIPSDESIDYYNDHPFQFIEGPQLSEQWDKSRVRDVYQFSSPTANGQFYIRNSANKDIVVYPPSAFKVEFASSSDKVPGAQFKITDPNGNVYLFGTYERSLVQASNQTSFQGYYKSAWYVDEIRTSLNDTINFNYEDDSKYIEKNYSQNISIENITTGCNCGTQQISNRVNPLSQSITTTTTESKKVSEITFDNGNSKIVFERTPGRIDLINGNSKLDIIKVMNKDASGRQFTLVKGYQFNYTYFNSQQAGTNQTEFKRLQLSNIQTLLEGDAHSFIYSDIELPSKQSYALDTSGYYNGKTSNTNLIPKTVINFSSPLTIGGANREVNELTNQAGVLKEVHYPTKGWTRFNYETNQIWGAVVSNFVSSLRCSVQGSGTGNSTGPTMVPGIDDDICVSAPNCIVYNRCDLPVKAIGVTATINISNDVADNETKIKYQYIRFKIFKNGLEIWDSGKKNRNSQSTITLNIPSGDGYIIAEAWGGNMSGAISISYSDSETVLKNNYAPGLRIGNIENYNFADRLISKKVFEYIAPDQNKSSAKWVNGSPLGYWDRSINMFGAYYSCTGGGTNGLPGIDTVRKHILTSSLIGDDGNSLIYEYVKESDINITDGSKSGYILYKYTTGSDISIDTSIKFSRPWARGNLLEKTSFKNNLITFVKKEINNYVEDQAKFALISGFKKISSAVVSDYISEEVIHLEFPPYVLSHCGFPTAFYAFNIVHKYNVPVNWEYLKSTKVIENFFNSANQLTDSIVTTKVYNYNNPTHLQLSSEVQVSSLGENIETKYFYPGDTEVGTEPCAADLVSKNILVPLKTQTFNNGNKLSERKTIYKNWGTTATPIYLPEQIKGSKGDAIAETRLRFVKVDNSNGNVLELKQENGISICYLYGYEGRYPIAKIENVTFSDLLSALGITEAALKSLTTAPSNLRTVLPNSMVTTYTFMPLVGVTSVTDPKGLTTRYNYDSSGRLNEVRDHDGNLLSENQYNYRPN